MKRTISAMVGKGSVNHNSRKFHAANTDPERAHLNCDYCNENIKNVYHKLFDEALKRYNDKQTRADRKINNYYEKIRSGKQEKPFHELILQIGNKDDMNSKNENGELAAKVLDKYYQNFQQRNPQLKVFSAHIHMDEATPHLHIDFVPLTTGSSRGLDTRVSLKQALSAQGFKGGTRGDTEWNQWVRAEKEQLAAVMQRHGIEWEHKDTHEKHLSLLDFEKKERIKEVAALGEEIGIKNDKVKGLSDRIDHLMDCQNAVSKISEAFETDLEYKLPEPQGLMSAKSYKTKFVEPLIKKLKSLVKTVLVKYFKAYDDYNRLNQYNGSLYKENERLQGNNEKLSSENAQLREENNDYKLLRKVFGNEQIDNLLEQAKQSKQRDTRFRKNNIER